MALNNGSSGLNRDERCFALKCNYLIWLPVKFNWPYKLCKSWNDRSHEANFPFSYLRRTSLQAEKDSKSMQVFVMGHRSIWQSGDIAVVQLPWIQTALAPQHTGLASSYLSCLSTCQWSVANTLSGNKPMLQIDQTLRSCMCVFIWRFN